MTGLQLISYHHAFHHHPAYHHAYAHGGGMVDWITHMALSSLVHGLVYGLVFKVMHRLTLGQAALLVAVVLVGLLLWGRSRDRAGSRW